MEINIKKVDNGFVVELQNHDVDEYKTFVFTKYSQVVKFLRDNLNSNGS